MYDILFRDATVLRPDCSGVDGHVDVAVADGAIALVAPTGHGREAAEVVDCRSKLVMPGLVDCHTHTGQQLLRGHVLDELPMIWTRVMLPFESALTPELMGLSARLCALEMIKSGTTAFADAGSYFMDRAAEVYLESGLRATLTCSTMDQPGLPASIACTTAEAVADNDRLFDDYDGRGLLSVGYSLRALMSCSEELVLTVSEHAAERGASVQAHMNEYPAEINHTLQAHGMRPFEYLDGLGVLDGRFMAAHCLMLSEAEKDIVAARGVKVCHCPFSNCAKGVPDAPGLQDRGVVEGFGTDGAAHGGVSLWGEMRLFRSVMNVTQGVAIADPAIMPAPKVVSMATEGGYGFLGVNGGHVREGEVADLITVDLASPVMFPTGDVVKSLMECCTAEQVRDMAVGGRMLMRDRCVLTIDEGRVMAEAGEYLSRSAAAPAAAVAG